MSKASNISETTSAIRQSHKEPSGKRGAVTGKSTGAGRKNANSNISSATEKSLNTTSNSHLAQEEENLNMMNDASQNITHSQAGAMTGSKKRKLGEMTGFNH